MDSPRRHHRSRSRTRSRSPYRSQRSDPGERTNEHRHKHSHHNRHHHRRHHRHGSHDRRRSRSRERTKPVHGGPKARPYDARELTKRDYDVFRPMFALYLDIQKGIEIEDIDEKEAKGRWKSFVGKWNRGELAEGWYDPKTLHKSIESTKRTPSPLAPRRASPNYRPPQEPREQPRNNTSDDEYGPSVAPRDPGGSRSGPAIPSMDDLKLKRELASEDAEAARTALQYERKADRAQQKERLDELAPRAEAGTRERQLEKRQDAAAANRAFAASKGAGGDGMAEVREADLMGGEDDGLAEMKRQKGEMERKKNERELRREEIVRAKREEREERAREFREREERTMAGLKELAKQRFG